MSLLTVMIKVLLFCVLNIVCLNASNVLRGGIVEAPAASDSFIGAVVEYLPQVKDSAQDTVYANVAEYGSIVKKIKQKYSSLRIVVFPEIGLISLDWNRKPIAEVYGEVIPDPSKRTVPCNDNTAAKAIRDLSCLAKQNNVYLVVNIPEKSTRNNSDIYYNTNIVYNPSGVLVARYRKFHIYGKDGEPYSRPEKPEVVTFDVDGVTFGTFTCFDIAFKSPPLDFDKKVTHIAFPTAWFSELPYLSAVQAHSAWSYAKNKVLLAADYNAPTVGASGSGIYLGDSSKGVAVQTQINGTFAIVSTIPRSIEKKGFTPTYEILKFYDDSNITQVPLKIKQDKLNVYTTEALEEPSSFQPVSENNNLTLLGTVGFNKKICNRDFCCEFVGNVTSYYALDLIIPKLAHKGDAFGSYNYQFAVFNGVRSYGDDYATGGVQVCSIVSCLENNIGLCGNRTDSAPPLTVSQYSNYQYKKVQTTFDILTIRSNLTTYSNTSATSNILLSTPLERQNETKNGFGEIADPQSYSLTRETIVNNETALHIFQIQIPISNPASLNIYNRIFTRDGERPTSGSNAMYNISSILFIIALVNAFIFNR